MSETIVNRVHVTPHLAAEIAKLHAVGAVANPVLQTADAQRAGQVGKIEFPQEEAPTMDELPVYDVATGKTVTREEFEAASEAAHSVISQLAKSVPSLQEAIDSGLGNSIIARGEFEKFKKEVIAAFKHLGLDTRKHFS